MNATATVAEVKPPGRLGLLHLAVLSTFAFAQPIFSLLGQFPTFLVAHRSSPAEIWLLVGVLCLAAPPVVVGVALLARLLGVRVGTAVFYGLLALLVALIVAPPLVRFVPRPGWLTIGLAVLCGAGAAAVYRRAGWLRTFATLLTPAWLVFPAAFVMQPGVAGLLSGEVDPKSFYGPVASQTPVVMVVFDGFPLADLLTADGQIDAARYPNFAALAAQSTWLRNATSVHQLTGSAVPAILTGNYPAPNLPVLRDHPYNLFTLLGGGYELNVYECLTLLCPQTESVDRRTLADDSLAARFRVLLGDTGLVYLHAVLPTDFTRRLPGVSDTWRNFLGASADDIRSAAGQALLDRSRRYEDFIASIRPTDRPVLHFLHLLLPHPPSVHAPSGKLYLPPNYQFTPGLDDKTQIWANEDGLVLQAYQRHLLQVALVDRLLGEMIARLKEAGLWDKALVVVTADHGDSYWPGQARRDPSLTNHPEDILCVPLFIKAPGQTQPAVSDRNVETIDILPTMAELLGIKLPWKVDGHSALDEKTPERAQKIIQSRGGRTLTFPAARPDLGPTLRRKTEHFGAGADPLALYRVGPRPELVGREVSSLTVEERTAGSVELNHQLADVLAHQGDRATRGYFVGTCRFASAPPGPAALAVVVDGRIEAVAPTYPQSDGGHAFAALVREEAFAKDDSPVAFHLVTGRGDDARLAPLTPKTAGRR